jgi:membrane protein
MKLSVTAWLSRVYGVGMQTYQAWRADRTHRLGAGMAYYSLFTFVPFLAVTAALAQPLVGSVDLQSFIAEHLAALGVTDATGTATDLTAQLDERETQASLGIVGGVSLLFAASLLFLALTDAMNTIWGVPVRSGWRNSIRRRLQSFAMVLISSVAIVLQFAVSAIVGAAEALIPGDVAILETLAPVLTSGLSWAGLWGIMILLLRFMTPDDMPWRVAIITGGITALLLVAGTAVIGGYLRAFGGSSLTGAFGAILGVLTWVYVEAQIVLAGVQLSKTLSRGPDWDPMQSGSAVAEGVSLESP